MQKIAADLAIIIGEARKSVAALQNIFSFKKKMFSRIEIMFWAIQIIFSTIWNTFRAEQKAVSVTPTWSFIIYKWPF
jgi:hypothetical protein